jgi:hypothetical protein
MMNPDFNSYGRMDSWRFAVLLLAISLLAVIPSRAQKKRDWQVGKLVSAEIMDAGTVALPVGGMVIAKDLKVWVYVIETDRMRYELIWKSREPLNLTVNGGVRFALEKNSAYVIDEDRKERKLSLQKKTAKEK